MAIGGGNNSLFIRVYRIIKKVRHAKVVVFRGVEVMPVWLKAAGVGSSILILIALLIAFLKQIIAFIAFLTGAIKLLIILVFIALLVAIGLMVLRGWKESRGTKE
jgi:hypothetical protein